MIIAIAANKDQVSEHFGLCDEFVLVHILNDKASQITRLQNPGHQPGILPKFLHGHNVQVIISGGMGKGAIDLFNAFKIEVITGACGTMGEVIELYIQGKLKSNQSICEEHIQHGNH